MDEVFVKAPKIIEVLLIDDSEASVGYISSVLVQDPFIRIIGIASDPYMAVEMLRVRVPDVIMLDVEMPRMNGLVFLQKLMRQYPIPVIVVSSILKRDPHLAAKAKMYGAFRILDKSDLRTYSLPTNDKLPKLCEIVREAHRKNGNPFQLATNKSSSQKIILIGASAGSPECIAQLLAGLPSTIPGIVIAIHMPPYFTKTFADRLNNSTSLNVREASEGDILENGSVLIAPGNRHIGLKKRGKDIIVKLSDHEHINNHRPSIDFFFDSAENIIDKRSLVIILSGMGRDGVSGMMKLKNKGVLTIAQDESTSPVYGMPKVATETGAAGLVLPLPSIASKIIKHFNLQ